MNTSNEKRNQMVFGPCTFAWMFCSKNWSILLTSDSFFYLKLNLLLDITELTLLQNKALFSSFCIAGRSPFDSSVSFETFIRYWRGMQFFKLLRLQSKSLICREKKSVSENKLKSFDYGFKIFSSVNVKANFNFAIHQSKTFVMILVNTFDVSSLMLVKKQWCWVILIVCSILFNWWLLKSWVKRYVAKKFPCQAFTILLRVPTKKNGLY